MRMRWGVLAVLISLSVTSLARAGHDEDRILGSVVSGLLGQPQDAQYVAQEQQRLFSFLQSGDYVTSRQGEPIDVMVLGIPLTHREHVYTARPIPPSQVGSSTRP